MTVSACALLKMRQHWRILGKRVLIRTTMCRNIKTLHNFQPPATDDEIRASSLQFVRKLSGFTKPSKANEDVFNRAVDQVTRTARELLASLVTDAPPRDREVEAAKAHERAAHRFAHAHAMSGKVLRLGSARVSRAGESVSLSRTFPKDCFGETPKPARETRALPRQKITLSPAGMRPKNFPFRFFCQSLPACG
jgi:hypothetical protein